MRLTLGLFLFAGACNSAPMQRPEPLTADTFAALFPAVFVTPPPAAILPGVDLPLREGDRVITNCAQAYAYTLPEMTIDEQMEFNANVTCVYPPEDAFEQSFAHYARLLRERGFQDESGTYVQSGMRILCNATHTVMIAIQSNFVPPYMKDLETDDWVSVPGGGELVNMSMAFTVSDRPCG